MKALKIGDVVVIVAGERGEFCAEYDNCTICNRYVGQEAVVDKLMGGRPVLLTSGPLTRLAETRYGPVARADVHVIGDVR